MTHPVSTEEPAPTTRYPAPDSVEEYAVKIRYHRTDSAVNAFVLGVVEALANSTYYPPTDVLARIRNVVDAAWMVKGELERARLRGETAPDGA